MKKVKGSFILEKFDKYGERKKVKIVKNFLDGVKKANKWEAKHPRNSAVLMRVLYNTFDNNNAWDYKDE